MAESNKVVIELSPYELEVLCGAISNFVPSDKSHEIILSLLYVRLENRLKEFLDK